MKEIIKYVADDDAVFDTEEECLAHENFFQKKQAVDKEMGKAESYFTTLPPGRIEQRIRNTLRDFFEWEYGA